MSKARRKKTPVIPASCIFEIPTSYQETLSQKRFMLMDFFLKRGTDRVIVYATDQQLQLLFSSEIVFVDGTFSTAPKGFDQVFLMHIQQFGQGKRVPCCENTKGISLLFTYSSAGRVLSDAQSASDNLRRSISTIER
jgi:hypothetical protein